MSERFRRARLLFLLSPFYLLQATGASPPRPPDISGFLARPWSKLFWVERTNGQYRTGDPVSRFGDNLEFRDLTFDISNNKVLANVGVLGELKNLTIYRGSYRVAGHPESLPGVWMAKDNSSYGPYSYKLRMGAESHDLAEVSWDFRTGLLDNIFPVTELRDPTGRFVARLLTYTPLSADGSERLRGVVYGLQVENVSAQHLQGQVELPGIFADQRQDFTKHPIHLWEPFEFEFALGDTDLFQRRIDFDLDPGESLWVPTILYMPGDPVPESINRRGTLGWLEESWEYYRGILGRLNTPGNEFLAEFFERQVLSSLQSIAMSADGSLAGTNWGSYPATREVWMKDAYYSCLPLTILDPSLAPPILLWFNQFGVRQEGTLLPGGVTHSLSLSVASIVLAGLYLEYTGDQEFFFRHPELRQNWDRLLGQMIDSRPDADIWLFPTQYISDGAVEGDYHTGTNVVAWRALTAFSRLLDEVYGDADRSRYYRETADRVRKDLLSKTVIEGPFGRQFIESVDKEGRPPRMASDGEESDTTLMPFYGLVPYDDARYLHYMRFSMSTHNQAYQPRVRAISWAGKPSVPLEDRVPATSPGYAKGLALGNDAESLFGEHGYYNEVRRVTDLDGSMWWWPYGWNSNPPRWDYEHPVRMAVPGKSGWFSGVHTVLFLTRYLGVRYDAAERTLHFAPNPLLGSQFQWEDFRLGKQVFSITYSREESAVEVSVAAGGDRPLNLSLLLPVEDLKSPVELIVNGKPKETTSRSRYLGRDSIQVMAEAPPGKTVRVVVSGSSR